MKKFLRLLILFLFGAYNYNLYQTSEIGNYINSRFFEFSHYASLIALIVSSLGMAYLVFKKRKKLISGVKEFFSANSIWVKFIIILVVAGFAIVININLLLIDLVLAFVFFKRVNLKSSVSVIGIVITLFLAFFTLPRGLTSITAAQRSADFNSVSLANSKTTAIEAFSNTDNYDLGDWIAAMNYNPDLTFYKGKSVKVKGFIFPNSNLGDNVFLVSRFVITCCAVDATPVGLPVIYSGWESNFKTNDWVQVTGTFDVQTLNGKQQLVINATKLDPISEPTNPYIY